MLTDFIVKLCRERTFTDSGAIRFGNTQHIVNAVSTDTGTGTDGAGHRVGARHIGIGTVVNIEHGTLSALKEEGLTFVHELIDRVGHVGQHGLNARGKSERLINDLIDIQSLGSK